MLLAGRYLEPFTGVKDKIAMLDFEGQFSFEDEEKLTRVNVGVPGLAGARWHELFDNAELGRFDEVPAVTIGSLSASPLVVLGGSFADDLCWQLSPPKFGLFDREQQRCCCGREDGGIEGRLDSAC
jgi:hypothetical protein